uniref:L-aminoadipate-semialdehyde dehydrogenase n=2 Tax=Talaromyces marneffei TaxID=37727 RepID=A0A093XUV8_TALMA
MGKGDTQSNSRQLLPLVFKNRAHQNPDGAWAQYPVSEHTYATGLQTATNQQAYNAINKVAWLLHNQLGPSSNFETIAYIGPFDPRYFIVVIAAIKVGYKAFLPSPRNSKVAQLNLLSRLECTKLVTVEPQPPIISAVLEEGSFTVIHIPSVQDLLSGDENNATPDYPYEKSYEAAKDEPIFVLHTSGQSNVPTAPEGFSSGNDTIRSGNWFTILAPFHISGIGFGLVVSAFNDCVPVYPLPTQPLSTAQFLDAVKHVDMDWAFALPFILEDLSKDPDALEFVSRKLKHLYFAGGSVPQAAGDLVASKIPVYQTTGSSEVSLLSQVHSLTDGSKNEEKWAYINIHPDINIEYRHHHGELHEMVIVRSKENEELQPVFLHFPELQEYETRDLLTPHPTLPGLWRYRARKDDIIVFLNGEKTNPISFEQEVSRHPEVRSAVVVGAQRFEACLLIELHHNDPLSPEEREQVIDRIWENVQAANKDCPAHARVPKENIILTDPSKPLPRAAKETVQRAATLVLYEEEIEKFNAERETQNLFSSKPVSSIIDLADPDAVSAKLGDLVSEITTGIPALLQLSRQLNISPSAIYSSPSIDLLTKTVMSQTSESTSVDIVSTTIAEYEKEIDKLAASVNESESRRNEPDTAVTNRGAVVALTGSTGAVGSYILQKLLQNDQVAHVYCLNRASGSEAIQQARNAKRGIKIELSPDRVTFLKVNLAKENFDLEDVDLYRKLQSTVTHFIHNAWPVNFNQTLQSFKSSLDGVLGLMSFATHAPRLASTVYLSSISPVSDYHQTSGADPNFVPEHIISDVKCPAGMGYGQSKYVAERILDYASKMLNLANVRVARVGQIAGTSTPEQGVPHGWNRHEWLPSLVISSHYLKAIPESLGYRGDGENAGVLDRIDWVPIDQLATLLLEISFGTEAKSSDITGVQVYHPINPNWVSWQSLVPTVVEALDETSSSTSAIKVLKYDEWLALLQPAANSTRSGVAKIDHSITADTLSENPAVKLLDFYESLMMNTDRAKPLAIEQTAKICPSLQSLDPIQSEWLRGWIKDWVLGSDNA